MKKLLLATTAFVALAAGSASAADMAVRPAMAPPPPVYTWTGIFWGVNLGYSWGEAKYDASFLGVGSVSSSQDIDGVIGGAQTGYNYQFGGAWVWGWESDFQFSGQKGGSTFAGIGPLTTVTTDRKLEWFGTARSRLGFLVSPTVLLYGTAGVAYGQVKNSATVNVAGLGSATSTFKDVKAGYAVGGGIEGALGGGWSAKLEYLYIDLGKTEDTDITPGLGVVASETWRTTDNIVRAGLNYKWGSFTSY
jgi:outer membrane immunogenic protein